MKRSRIIPILMTTAMVICLSGCMIRSADQLYAVPKLSTSIRDLDRAIENILSDGLEYAAPDSGSNQQAVQMADLDGDGISEALLFVRTEEEHPLRLYLFHKQKDSYENTAILEFDGSGFAQTEYLQLDGRAGLELAVTVQVSDQIPSALTVYSFSEDSPRMLMSEACTTYAKADLDNDGISELILLHKDTGSGSADYWDITDDGSMNLLGTAELSAGSGNICRILTGDIQESTEAVLVTSEFGTDQIATDVLALQNDTFSNISMNQNENCSLLTSSDCAIFPTDIDSDSIIEFPDPVSIGEDCDIWLINWQNMSSSGTLSDKMTVLQNYDDGWYLQVPAQWRQLSLRAVCQSGTDLSEVSLCLVSEENGEEVLDKLLTVSACSGDNRNENAILNDGYIITEKSEITYAIKIWSNEYTNDLTAESVAAGFHFAHSEWNAGVFQS